MRATDSDGDSLTYTLYYSTSLSGTYTNAGTVTGSSGSYVTKTVSGLSQYTLYYWYIAVTDGIAITTSAIPQVRTYCPGTGKTCYGGVLCELGEKCSNCSNGTITCNSSSYVVTGKNYFEPGSR